MLKTKPGLILTMLSLAIAALAAGELQRGQHIANISGKVEKINNLEIVKNSTFPIVNYAASELQEKLFFATGSKPAIVDRPTPGFFSLILGAKDELDLPQDAFVIRREGQRIHLFGKDSETADPKTKKWVESYDRGTLNAVYEFLERFAGARFYFPHKHGVVITKKDALYLPEEIYIFEAPDYFNRSWCSRYMGQAIEEEQGGAPDLPARSMLQLRFRTFPYAQSNALNHFDLVKRFAKTNPEYFALLPDGKRYCEADMVHTGQLCFESEVREVIYQDVKAYLTGQPAESRGMKHWDINAFADNYVCLCPQDWFYWCGCEKCQKIAPPGRDSIYKESQQKISDYIWQFTVDIANRLTREGVKGKIVQLAYIPYNLPPNCVIPDNVLVPVAVFPGIAKADHPRMADTERFVQAWRKIVPQNIYIRAWTGKTMDRKIPAVPALKHNHIADYFSQRAGWFSGAFIDEHTDHFMFAYLNVYVFSKVAWNNNIDTKALIDEHFKLMFGDAAKLMHEFYDELESLWNDKVLVGRIKEHGLGVKIDVPGEIDIWTKIYSAEKMLEWNKLFDQAEKISSGLERERVKFMREKLFAPLLSESRRFTDNLNSVASWSTCCGDTVFLRPHRGNENEVQTKVEITENEDSFSFNYYCEEPLISKIKADASGFDQAQISEDSCVETFIKPNEDRPLYFQFVVNAKGALADYCWGDESIEALAWNSGAKASASQGSNYWAATITIPKKVLGDYDPDAFRINLGRRRAFNGDEKVKEEYYKWSPYPGGSFHMPHRWGTLQLQEKADNLLADPGFEGEIKNKWSFGAWAVWYGHGDQLGQKVEYDARYFIRSGRSLHLLNSKNNVIGVSQQLVGLKEKTHYRLSYYVRCKNVDKQKESLYALIYVEKDKYLHFPKNYISGDNEWTRLSFDFITPETSKILDKPLVSLNLRAAGEAWFDHIKVEEIRD
jgi:hypothetical protein